jgi:pyroglutamyl-peptidase
LNEIDLKVYACEAIYLKKVLVTGFEPFGGEVVNPALEAIHKLKDISIEDVCLVVREIPTVFHTSIEVLRQTIESEQPDVVICVGQAGGRSDITVERIAINIDDARIPDNAGNQPIDQPIIADGPAAYWSTLPIKAIVHNMRTAGIPASVSQTAGTFVCNHLFYGLSHMIASTRSNVRGGFIHIPFLPEQAVKHPGQPSMSLDTIVQGLKIAIETSVTYQKDLVQAEGQIC